MSSWGDKIIAMLLCFALVVCLIARANAARFPRFSLPHDDDHDHDQWFADKYFHILHRNVRWTHHRPSHSHSSLNITWPVKRIAQVPGHIILGGLMMVHEREDSITCGAIMPQVRCVTYAFALCLCSMLLLYAFALCLCPMPLLYAFALLTKYYVTVNARADTDFLRCRI